MSDTTDSTTTPQSAPAAPAATTAPVETTPATATPEAAPTALVAPTPETSATVAADPDSAAEPTDTDPPETSENSGDSSTSSSDTTDAEDAHGSAEEVQPEVVNDDSGQHVNMPDGSVVYTRHDSLPRSNAEQANFELTHSGDQLRYPYVPGDKEYSAYSDPAVPNSHLARMVETEIVSFGERVLSDPNAAVSTMWKALKGVFDGELKAAITTGEGSGKIVEV